MRLVVEVPDAMGERFKAAVHEERQTQADVVRQAIKEYVSKVEAKNRKKPA